MLPRKTLHRPDGSPVPVTARCDGLFLLGAAVWLIAAMLVACKTGSEYRTAPDGRAELVTYTRVAGVTVSEKTEPQLTQEEFDRQLAQELAARTQEIELAYERQKLHDQQFCRIIMYFALGIAAAALILGYIFRDSWQWWAGLSVTNFAVAFLFSVMADILHWSHAWYVAPSLIVIGLTLFLFRKFSLLEWVKSWRA